MSHEPAIDRYVDSIFARYQAALREHAATLAEPHAEEIETACHRLDKMIETLTAFAIGHAVGRVAEAMRRIDATLAAPIAGALTAASPRMASSTIGPSPLPPLRFLADAERRPLVDALGARLHARLGLAARQARTLVRAVADAVTRAGRGPALASALELLTGDPAAAFAFADQLALGWRFLVATLADAADPDLADEPRWQRGRALWTAWSRRIRGTRAQTTREYILRVA